VNLLEVIDISIIVDFQVVSKYNKRKNLWLTDRKREMNKERREQLLELLRMIDRLSDPGLCPKGDDKNRIIWEIRNRDWEQDKQYILEELNK
jgi:hypothetical protein